MESGHKARPREREFLGRAALAHPPTPPHSSPARDTFLSAGLSSPNACRQGGTHSGTVPAGRGSKGDSRGGTAGNRGAKLAFGKTRIALLANFSLTCARRRAYGGRAAVARKKSVVISCWLIKISLSHAHQVICHGVRFSPRASARIHSPIELSLTACE